MRFSVKRGTIFHFRIRVPEDLQCTLSRKEIKKSLSTG